MDRVENNKNYVSPSFRTVGMRAEFSFLASMTLPGIEEENEDWG